MKKQSTPTERPVFAVLLKNPQGRRILEHILSPLEIAALRHNYQPFNYRYGRISLAIGPAENAALLEQSMEKIKLFTRLLGKAQKGLARGLKRVKQATKKLK